MEFLHSIFDSFIVAFIIITTDQHRKLDNNYYWKSFKVSSYHDSELFETHVLSCLKALLLSILASFSNFFFSLKKFKIKLLTTAIFPLFSCIPPTPEHVMWKSYESILTSDQRSGFGALLSLCLPAHIHGADTMHTNQMLTARKMRNRGQWHNDSTHPVKSVIISRNLK